MPVHGAGLTKHDLVAESLARDIRTGKYRAGDRLPSEAELGMRFGVSRQTVRAALRTLRELGLVNSHQGVGTRVNATRGDARYTQAFDSAEDLMQYATTTRLKLIGREEIEVDPALAALFGCKPGEHWWRLRTVRSAAAGRSVLAYSEVHVPLAFGAVLTDIARESEPVFVLIERRFNERIVEIQQDITSIASLGPQECAYLKLPPGSPGMQIIRHYHGRKGRLLEVARTVHPSGVFKYSMRVRLQHGERERD